MNSLANDNTMLSPAPATPSMGNRGVPHKPKRRSTLSPKEQGDVVPREDRKRRTPKRRASSEGSTDSNASRGSGPVSSQVLMDVLYQQSKELFKLVRDCDQEEKCDDEAEDILSEAGGDDNNNHVVSNRNDDGSASLPSLVSYRMASVTSIGTASRSSSFSSSCSSMMIAVKDALDQLDLDSDNDDDEEEDEDVIPVDAGEEDQAKHIRKNLPLPPPPPAATATSREMGDDSTPKMINLIHRKHIKRSRNNNNNNNSNNSISNSFQDSFLQDSFVMDNLSQRPPRPQHGRSRSNSFSNSQECTLQDSFFLESQHQTKHNHHRFSDSSQAFALQDSFATASDESPSTPQPQPPRSILKSSKSMPQPPRPTVFGASKEEDSRTRMLKAFHYQKSTTDRSRSYSSSSYSNSSFSNSSDRSRWDPE